MATPPLDVVTLYLFMAVLSAFDIGESSVESMLDDSQLDESYPLVTDGTFVPSVHQVLLAGGQGGSSGSSSSSPTSPPPPPPPPAGGGWACPLLYSALKFAWGVLLRECAFRSSFEGRDVCLFVNLEFVCVCVCVCMSYTHVHI